MTQEVTSSSENSETIGGLLHIEIVQLTQCDNGYFSELVGVFQKTFLREKIVEVENSHLRHLLSDPKFIAVAALRSGKVIGGLTAYVLDDYYAAKPSVFLYDLAVLLNYQRRGIGKRLLSACAQLCEDKGYRELFVQAEADDGDAIAFYRSTGISGETNAIQFHYTLIK